MIEIPKGRFEKAINGAIPIRWIFRVWAQYGARDVLVITPWAMLELKWRGYNALLDALWHGIIVSWGGRERVVIGTSVRYPYRHKWSLGWTAKRSPAATHA